MAPLFHSDGNRPAVSEAGFIALCERLAAEHASRSTTEGEARTRLAIRRWRSRDRAGRRRSGSSPGRR